MSRSVYENVEALGRRFGYTMKDIANAMEVSLGTLYHRRKDPDSFTLRELRAFARKIGISPAELLTEDAVTGRSAERGGQRCRRCVYEKPLGGCAYGRKGKNSHDDF